MSVAFRSRWLEWTPADSEEAQPPAPAKPPKPGFAGFAGGVPRPVPEIRALPAQPVVCFSCWGSDFWQGTGALVCRRCHPPAPGAEVLTPSRIGSGTPRPVEIEAGSSALTPDTRTHGVRGGAA